MEIMYNPLEFMLPQFYSHAVTYACCVCVWHYEIQLHKFQCKKGGYQQPRIDGKCVEKTKEQNFGGRKTKHERVCENERETIKKFQNESD